MTKKIFVLAVLILLIAAGVWVYLAARPQAQPEAQNKAGLANPASVNCIEKGGQLMMKERGDGGQYGICYFEDNRQCEEWALFRGDCPVGGVKVTGYITEAAAYCAVTGGEYAITSKVDAAVETGTCQLKDNTICDAQEYWKGQCPTP